MIGSLAARHDLISFAAGAPHVAGIPGDEVLNLVIEVMRRDPIRALQYTGPQGLEELRVRLAPLMGSRTELGADRLVVTAGASQALDLVAKVALEPGDLVVTGIPTFPTALAVFALYGTEVATIPSDDNGIDVDALAALVRDGRRPKLVYTIPTFSNPTGATLSLERRLELARLCEEAGILVLEDDTYGPLRYDGSPLPHLVELCPGCAIYLGSVSKSFVPGLRLGWIVPPEHLLEPFVVAQELSTLCVSPFSQLLLCEYLSGEAYALNLASLRTVYRSRRDALLDALDQHLAAGADWTRPQGGFFVWVELADLTADELFEPALERGVAFVPGSAFYPETGGEHQLRLSFSSLEETAIERGIALLGALVTERRSLA